MDLRRSGVDLGVAIHYITDRQALPHRHGAHESFEHEISKCPITATQIPQGKKHTLDVATQQIRLTDFIGRVKVSPQQALNTAYMLSMMVASSVLSDPSPLQDMRRNSGIPGSITKLALISSS